MTTTVLIAEDQPLIRDGLAAILSMVEGYRVVAKIGDGAAAVEQALLLRPDLILMDIQMPKLDGLRATKRIKAELPNTAILIMTTFEDEDYIWEALQSGANGYVAKGVETDKLLSAIRDCLDGRINYPLSIQARLIRTLGGAGRQPEATAVGPEAAPQAGFGEQAADRSRDRSRADDGNGGLSAQERNILRHLKTGKSNRSIAGELFLSVGTVKNYLNVIYKKLNVASRAEAIAYLHEHGL